MKKSFSMFCALITTFIWGTAFIAQDTGMDNIGPLTFNSSRFLSFNRYDSTKISFYLSIPVIAGASFLGLKDAFIAVYCIFKYKIMK